MDPMMVRILELETQVKELQKRLKNCKCGKSKSGDIYGGNHSRFFAQIKSFFNSILHPQSKVSPVLNVEVEKSLSKNNITKSKSDMNNGSKSSLNKVKRAATSPIKSKPMFD